MPDNERNEKLGFINTESFSTNRNNDVALKEPVLQKDDLCKLGDAMCKNPSDFIASDIQEGLQTPFDVITNNKDSLESHTTNTRTTKNNNTINSNNTTPLDSINTSDFLATNLSQENSQTYTTDSRTESIKYHNYSKKEKVIDNTQDQILQQSQITNTYTHQYQTLTHYDDIPPSISIQQDTTTKKAVKTRHPFMRLTLFFIICLISIIVGYKILVKGIHIDNLSIANIHVSNIFLQLNERLSLQIESLDLRDLHHNDDTEKKDFSSILHEFIDYTQKTLYMLGYFNKLEIQDIIINDTYHAQLKYNDTQYEFYSPDINAKFAIANNTNTILLKIEQFQLKKSPLQFDGELIFSLPQKQLFFGINAILPNVSNKEKIAIKGVTDFRTITINAQSSRLQNLNVLQPYIDNIENKALRNTLNAWIFEKVKYDTLKLESLSMNIHIDDISETLLKNTKARIVIFQPQVTLNKGVAPITGKEAAIEFKDTNLKITALQPKFSSMDLSNSEVLITNLPHSSTHITLNGKNVKYNTDLEILLASYGIKLPIKQKSDKRAQIDSKATQNLATSKRQKIQNFYNTIQTFNPQTNLTNELITQNPLENNEQSSMKLNLTIKHNDKEPKHPLFSLQGMIQANNTSLELYKIPLDAKNLNIALDITPKQKLVYINGEKVQWKRIIQADINLFFDINKHAIQANTLIHQASINTNNLDDLKFMQDNLNTQIKQYGIKDNNPTTQHHTSLQTPTKQRYSSETKFSQTQQFSKNTFHDSIKHKHNDKQESKAKNLGIYLSNAIDKPYNYHNYRIYMTATTPQSHNLLANQSRTPTPTNTQIPQEELDKLPKNNIKDDGKEANRDEKVLKTLKNNPVWNDLKIRTKKTRPFTPLNNQELKKLALQEIQQESFSLKQDFLAIKNTKLDFNLSFANDTIILDIPLLSLHLESSKEVELKIAKIENVLQFSPLAQYYGITHGSFDLEIPYSSTKQQKATIFTLNLTQLQHPIYTLSNERVSELTLHGKIQNNSLIIVANDNIDFKMQNSLSMLRINGYKINADEAFHSKIPFLIDLLKDKQSDSLPYSDDAIRQELHLIAIKNQLRKKMNIQPFDFNILGNNLQLVFLGYTIPFDSVNMRFIDGRIIIDGQYERGILNASFIKDNISLRAKNFSGNFINTILTSAKNGKKMVNGGIFSLDMLYRGKIVNGSIEFQNTAIIELKAIQNIFALIDTVPSLFMFKNPHISTTGYQVNFGKVLFAINNDYVGLQNIFMLGNSMDINGQGIIDIDTQEMNINLGISTIKNLSKFINKIPIIGYLILGREGQISTNLILTGKYVDPKVNITLATDIIKAPFNILKRVFPIEDMMIEKNEVQDTDY